MSTLVSREDVLLAVRDYFNSFEDTSDRDQLANEVISAIMSAKTVNEGWNPTGRNGKLPDYNERVLVCGKMGGVSITHRVNKDGEKYWKNPDGSKGRMFSPVAWMPLPPSYREE